MDTNQAGSVGDAPKPEYPLTKTEPAPTNPPAPTVEDEADPDEDDLDDLDDLLGEFSGPPVDSKKPTPASGPSRPSATNSGDTASADAAAAGHDELSEEEFERQLQESMAKLMGDLGDSSDMQAQFENMFKELGAAAAGSSDDATTSAPESSKTLDSDFTQDASFQETIRKTMERMRESGDQATAAAATDNDGDLFAEMAKLMKNMPGEDGDENDLSTMLMGMMEQLTNKEILYEPMKELHDKFPGWMTKNKDTLPKEDLKRYQEQQVLVAEMVTKFEQSSYSDSNTADREYIVDRMQRMQASGSPPHDLVGDMPSAKEVLEAPEGACATQ